MDDTKEFLKEIGIEETYDDFQSDKIFKDG